MSCEANLVVFTSEDLKLCTNNFHKNNLIGLTQFGKLYRGQIKQQGFSIGSQAGDVTVKVWDERSSCITFTNDEFLMVKEEIQFLTHPSIKGHPNLVNLIGYCCEKEVKGVIYDLSPWDTLHNLIPKDNINWVQRVNVLLQFAQLLEFLHNKEKPYLVLNTNASHIMLDWEGKPTLVDYGLISGGIIGEMTPLKKKMPMHTIGFVDPFFAAKGGSYWDTSCDVFSFGVILLGLIAKRNSELENVGKPQLGLDSLVHNWAKNVYRPNFSLVHRSLQEDWGYFTEDGTAITELGMRCVEFFPVNRPTMKKVVECLQGLLGFRRLEDARPNKREKTFHGN
ncbi:PREDICTED: protein kinase APK1B, chloroplastic-like [Fragaria vesca subsp. vesca]|uniref:protein kinase APK1B, chloroplastic-like n=1 Tax=Fragaria vesca subsp. vesca TaxID=101020 RepID=UPI0002C367B2|nr:PREDICTED: protein kinase APK1B, chloroplastic-like [Fragaria vesca subsp. vesca]